MEHKSKRPILNPPLARKMQDRADRDKQDTPPAPPTGQQMFEFLLLFDKASGSPKVNYFMVDPFAPSRIFPKMNTIAIHRIKNISGYKPVACNNCLYLIGGKDWNTGSYISGVWKFDPRINQWSTCRAMNVARCRFTAEVVDGFLYVMGGETQNSKVTDSMERYDPLNDRWTPMCPLPKPRVDHASAVLNGTIFVSGGISNLKYQCSNVFWYYNPEDGLWREIDEGRVLMPHEREKHNMIPVGSSKILILSGRGFDQETFSEKDEGAVCHFNIHGVDPEKAFGGLKPYWDNDHPNMPHPRSNAAVMPLGRNIWVIGGLSYNKGTNVKMVSYYDMHRRRWREAFALPEGHFCNLDGVLLQIPVTNKDFCFVDRFIYDRWIMW